MRSTFFGLLAATAIACNGNAAHAALAYSFEGGTDGFGPNGGGVTVTGDTIGATNGTGSLKVAVVNGATFVGALTGAVTTSPINDPPGVTSIFFDVTLPAAYTGTYADIGVTIFGASQPDHLPSQLFGLQAQFADYESLGGKAPGTYTVQIDLASATNQVDFSTGQSFNQIFGQVGDGPNVQIPTGFQIFVSKSNDAPLTFYIDNIRTNLVPEPASVAMLSLGGVALLAVRRKS
jgi:hypothetical protein